MRQYILNLTNHLIGKHKFDEMRESLTGPNLNEKFREHVQLNLEVDDVMEMNPATLGKIMCSFEIGDVMSSHLGKEVYFNGDCEEMLRDLVARALAYVITDRLDPVQPNNVPPYRQLESDGEDGLLEQLGSDEVQLNLMPANQFSTDNPQADANQVACEQHVSPEEEETEQ